MCLVLDSSTVSQPGSVPIAENGSAHSEGTGWLSQPDYNTGISVLADAEQPEPQAKQEIKQKDLSLWALLLP